MQCTWVHKPCPETLGLEEPEGCPDELREQLHEQM